MSNQLSAIDQTAAGTTSALVPVGTYAWDSLGRLFQYCKGAATCAVNEYVKISTDSLYTVTSMTTTTNPTTEPAQVGCLQMTGGVTSSLYGWVFRGYGLHTGLFAANCVQNVKIYATAPGVNGQVDDAATTLVNGLKLITTITGAAASPAWANGLLLTAYA